MSHNPRVEEIDDPDEFDISSLAPPLSHSNPSLIQPQNLQDILSQQSPPAGFPGPQGGPKFIPESEAKNYKNFQTVYPCYFDINRSLKEGRRVGKQYAVENPLAFEIVHACQSMGLRAVFEPTKAHPKDWANTGRVKVAFDVEGVPKMHSIKSKHELYKRIGEHLKRHPTTEESPLEFKFPNLPVDTSKPPPPVAVPKGWKMNTIVPLHSPAMSGGGVSDNFFKDMMAEMGGAGGAGMPGLPGGMDMAAMAKMMGNMGLGGGAGSSGSGAKAGKKGKK